MIRLLIHWLLSAFALFLVSQLVRGFYLRSFAVALFAAIVIGLINATIGAFLKLITFPLTILTLGLFWFVINALMLWLATVFVPGFKISGFGAAFIGAVILAFVNLFFRAVMPKRRAD